MEIGSSTEYVKEDIKLWLDLQTDEGFTALHFASFRGNTEIIEVLLLSGADINTMTYQGLSVFHVAA